MLFLDFFIASSAPVPFHTCLHSRSIRSTSLLVRSEIEKLTQTTMYVIVNFCPWMFSLLKTYVKQRRETYEHQCSYLLMFLVPLVFCFDRVENPVCDRRCYH